jgi:hypothetical protein
VLDDDPPWTLPGVEGKKAEDREKNSDSFYGNFSAGRRPSVDMPGEEGKKAEEKEKNSDSFYGNLSVG